MPRGDNASRDSALGDNASNQNLIILFCFLYGKENHLPFIKGIKFAFK